MLFRSDGDDDLSPGGGSSLIIGGSGDDTLSSGGGRGILIGGMGKDHLKGGKADDILIGGTTDFDNVDAALAGIMDEWNSWASYDDRIKHLSGVTTGGKNGVSYLNASSVHDDGQSDELQGSGGMDWYFAKLDKSKQSDNIFGQKKNEVVTSIR